MKANIKIRYFVLIILILACGVSCGKLDYENKEFFKKELYIISGESTSATERTITSLQAYTFNDTLKILNEEYDVELIEDLDDGLFDVKFRVGIGGSLAADEDITVQLAFDEELLKDYNVENNMDYYIPDDDLYNVNVPYNAVNKTFTVVIKKGTSSSALIFSLPIKRDDIAIYEKFAFPLHIVEASSTTLSSQYTNFMVAHLIVDTDRIVNWSGFPIPKLPEGRYHSARLQGNAGENNVNGVHYNYKYITRLSNDPKDEGQFMIWGTGVWSFEVFGMHGLGWMYNRLYLNNVVYGTYTMEPIPAEDPKFPMATFRYSTIQNSSFDNSYDPKTKTLTLHYKNVIGSDYTDVLTFVDDNLNIRDANTQFGPHNWEHVRQSGYAYWLPIDGE